LSELGYGSGWTAEGLDLYNKIHELVKADRVKNGSQFNQKLRKALTERREQVRTEKEKAKTESPRKRRKPIPVDDLDDFYGLDSSKSSDQGGSILLDSAVDAICQSTTNVTPI
jgi:hypothetical protein